MPSRPSRGGTHGGHAHQQQGGGQQQQQGRRSHRPKDAKASNRKACRFHFSSSGGGGCRRGDGCRFSHDPADDPGRRAYDGGNGNGKDNGNKEDSSPTAKGVGGGVASDGTSPTTVVDSAAATPTAPAAVGPDKSKSSSKSTDRSVPNSRRRRPCRFGADCRHRISGNCRHEHPQDCDTSAVASAGVVNNISPSGASSSNTSNRSSSPPLPPPPPTSWVAGTNTGVDASQQGAAASQPQFEYRRYASPTPESNPYAARTDLESLLLVQSGTASTSGSGSGSSGGTNAYEAATSGSSSSGSSSPTQTKTKSDKERILMASLGLTSEDLRIAVHGAPAASAATTVGAAACATNTNTDQTIEHVSNQVNNSVNATGVELDDDDDEEYKEEYTQEYEQDEEEIETATYYQNAATTTRSLLSPITLAEAEHNLSKLSTLSRSFPSSASQQQSIMEEFNSALQMCRSVQMTVVDVLQRAMMGGATTMGGDDTGSGEEEQLTQLLELNESLLATIAGAERSFVEAREGAARAEAEREGLDREQPAFYQKHGRTKDEDFGLAPAEDNGGGEAPKKATKKKRIRKKKNKDKDTAAADDADAASESKPKAATHTPEELAKIKAKELEAARRAEAASAEAAERAKQDERDRLAKMREEARKQQAAARERKKAKKVQKYQRKVAEQVEAEAVRTRLWAEERAKSKGRTAILESLCITELIRQSSTKVMGLSFSRVQEDDSAIKAIRDVSNKAYLELYKHDAKRRVIIAGVDATGGANSNGKKELNGRHGTILSYDEAKDEYSVALDTKKGKQDDVQPFKPENLDMAEDGAGSAAHSKNAKSTGKGKANKNAPGAKGHHTVDHSYGICLPGLLSYGGVSLDLEYFLVSQSDVVEVEKASTLDAGLKAYSAKRDKEERIQKLLEEEERAREAEERKRRAELRAREEAERRRRQAEKEREREEMLEFLRKQKERMAAGEDDDSDEGHHHRRQYYESDEEEYDDDDDEYGGYGRYGGACDCVECRMRARMRDFMFMSMFGGMRGGGMGGIPHPIFMSMFGGMGGPGMGGFYGEDDDDDEYYEEEDDGDDFYQRFFFGGGFDDAYEEREAQRRQEENEEQAEILGVPVDADAKTIKTKYRRLAIQYHPDKWRQDSEHGMTKEDAEEEFKKIQSAYDHLMANFDEDD